MIYKMLKTTEDGIKIFARIDDDGKCRLTCSQYDQNFKKQINADEAQLEDAEGVVMTPEQAKTYVATLP